VPEITTTKRLNHLDSLRGIAALAVALFHCLIRFSGPDKLGINALLGSCAVLFFFVLSGFVLGRSLMQKPVRGIWGYMAYVCRRFFRLYPAILFALLVYAVVNQIPPPPKSPIFVDSYMWPQYGVLHQGIKWWIEELLLINTHLCPVMWSLQAEFLCSFFLPVAVLFSAESNFRQITMCLVFAFLMAPFFSGVSFYLPANPVSGTPLKYFFAFYMGYLVNRIPNLDQIMSCKRSIWLLTLGLLTLIPIGSFGSSFGLTFSALPVSVVVLFAMLLSVLVPCNIPALRSILLSKPISFVGRCSYSFYLLHCAGISGGLWILHLWLPGLIRHPVWLPAFALFVLTLSISLPLAGLAEWLVERPFNRWGHTLAKGITVRKAS
jgi:peptidoglycan/LPS O-acetylase OafA/YrhL